MLYRPVSTGEPYCGAPGASGIAVARGLFYFHLGVAGIFAGCGFAAWFCLFPLHSPGTMAAPIAGVVIVGIALCNAAGWSLELRRRRASRAANETDRV